MERQNSTNNDEKMRGEPERGKLTQIKKRKRRGKKEDMMEGDRGIN